MQDRPPPGDGCLAVDAAVELEPAPAPKPALLRPGRWPQGVLRHTVALAAVSLVSLILRQQNVQWTDQERLEFAEAIDEEAQRLNRSVGNLLGLSRIQGGSQHPDRCWNDLGVLIEDVLDRSRMVTTHHRVQMSVPDDLPAIWLDPVEIGQVLYNLIENATRYAPAGTPINVELRRQRSSVRVAVMDRGPGVPAVALPHLFDPFSRVIDGRVRAPVAEASVA